MFTHGDLDLNPHLEKLLQILLEMKVCAASDFFDVKFLLIFLELDLAPSNVYEGSPMNNHWGLIIQSCDGIPLF